MKTLFANLKGGSGKTTLAIHLANYLYYYCNKEVALVSFHKEGNLKAIASIQNCPYPVIEMPLSSDVLKVDTDIVVMETGSNGYSKEMEQLIKECDVLITPFQYQLLDFQALRIFYNHIRPLYTRAKKYLALPNCILLYQHLKSRASTDELIKQEGFSLLPPVITSKYISSISFRQPSKQTLNVYRATFCPIF